MSEPANVTSVELNQVQVKIGSRPRVEDRAHSQHPTTCTHGEGVMSSTSQPPLSLIKSTSVPPRVHQEPKLSSVHTPVQHSQSLIESGVQGPHVQTESLKYRPHCDSSSSVDSVLAPSDVSVSSGTFVYPFLDLKEMSEDETIILKGRLTNDYKRINGQYNSLVQNVIHSLSLRGTTPKQLSLVLMNLNTFSIKKNVSNCPLLQDQLDKVKMAESIGDAFYILRSYTSFFDYYILGHIVDHLGTDDDRDELKRYRCDLNDYCQRNVFECPHFSNSDPHRTNLVMKVDEIVIESFTLNALNAFRVTLAEVLGLERHTLLLYTVETGCLKLTFQVPQFAVADIFSLTAEQRVALGSLGVFQLICSQRKLDLSTPQQPKVCTYI